MDAVGSLAAELGYDLLDGALLRVGDAAVDAHPFAPELRAAFRPTGRSGEATAEAVFCLDQVPTVCLVDRMSLETDDAARREQVRNLCERLWNQNLARVVLVASTESLEAWSVDNPQATPERVFRGTAATSAWSFSGLASGEVLQGRDAWFDAARRVDRQLLDSISELVRGLVAAGREAPLARRLVARLIFVTYLEDRGIIGEAYRQARKVQPLITLVQQRNAKGLTRLFAKLRNDFNGDFLNSADGERGWESLSADAYEAIHEFLAYTTRSNGERCLWRYDFSQIPIELIASIYETFLSQKDQDDPERNTAPSAAAKRRQGAYYTPRALADWVVDLALQGRDPLKERIYDPACGSGMLLTAAYRRLVRTLESRDAAAGKPGIADFATRKALLTGHIFGADIDEDACQLTSFSLYLALLADLSPTDLVELQAGGAKLPPLTKNIRRGPQQGDFFSEAAAVESAAAFTIVLSNPPWRELANGEPALAAMTAWLDRQPAPRPRIPKNQIAAAFTLGAADALATGGRAALILPIGLFVSNDKAQRDFRAHLLGRYRIRQIVNFADMRRLIFTDASHPFVVLVAEARVQDERFGDVETERFAYWTPKTDMSIALGRLAVHGSDRAELPASALIDNVPQLGLRYWGSEPDLALLAKLRRHGRVQELVDHHGWAAAKGFHATDNDRRRPKETWRRPIEAWIQERPFLDARMLRHDMPVCLDDMLARLPYDDLPRTPPQRLFEGPRVVWPDGTHPENGVKAMYADRPFSFKHSLAVLSAPDTEEGRLTAQFLTAYMRSPLALWLQLLLSSSVASERPKLHLQEALAWPFWPLDGHPDTDHARTLMLRVAEIFDEIASGGMHPFGSNVEAYQDELDACVYSYFGLIDEEISLLEELARFAGPALQPAGTSRKALARPIRLPPTQEEFQDYCETLETVMARWRDATGGEGEISVASWTARSAPLGAAVLSVGTPMPSRRGDDAIAEELATAYRRLTGAASDDLLTIPDLALVDGSRIFLIKPLITRFWLRRTAIEDASQLAMQLLAIGDAKGIA